MATIDFTREKLMDSYDFLRKGLCVGYCPFCDKLDILFSCENTEHHSSVVCLDCTIQIKNGQKSLYPCGYCSIGDDYMLLLSGMYKKNVKIVSKKHL